MLACFRNVQYTYFNLLIPGLWRALVSISMFKCSGPKACGVSVIKELQQSTISGQITNQNSISH